MMMRIADWHGEQAAFCYSKWSQMGNPEDLRDYVRHARISKVLWRRAYAERRQANGS